MPYLVKKSNVFPPHIVDDPYWQDEWGSRYTMMLPYFDGCPIGPKFLPKGGYLEADANSLASFVPLPTWLCTAEVKDVIESVEPDVHRFHPFAVRRNETSQEVVQEYLTINFCNSLKVFNPNTTDPKLFKKVGNGLVFNDLQININRADGIPINLAIHEDVMQEHHAALDPRIGFGSLFLSDAMHDALLPYLNNGHFWVFKTV